MADGGRWILEKQAGGNCLGVTERKREGSSRRSHQTEEELAGQDGRYLVIVLLRLMTIARF
jgi:hypothetical protein